MAGFLDACRFVASGGGTTDWIVASAVAGYMTPALAGAVNGAKYKYRAESPDLSQWEIGEGTHNASTGVLSRATVHYNSSGTGMAAGQSGAGARINFAAAPAVAIVALAEDMVPQAQGHLPGEPSTGNANTGDVGELISAGGGPVALTSGTGSNVCSIGLTAGDWDITGHYIASGSGNPPVTDFWVSINTISGANVFLPGQAYRNRGFTMNDAAPAGSIGPFRVSLSSSTTYYLNVQALFSSGGMTVSGLLRARRAR